MRPLRQQSLAKVERPLGRPCWKAIVFSIALAVLVSLYPASRGEAEQPFRLGLVALLSGAAVGSDGFQERNAAELVVDAINAGTLPAPYDSPGLAGRPIEMLLVDEAGGSSVQVVEFRNLVQRQGADAVVGYASSSNCLAVAPHAEELRMLTVFSSCLTPRLFQESDYRYVFRTLDHAGRDNLAMALYIAERMPELASYIGINQDYAFGHDSWAAFSATMEQELPGARNLGSLFPQPFVGRFGSELSRISLSGAALLHVSLWGRDLETFFVQALARGLTGRSLFAMTMGEPLLAVFAERVPEGTVMIARSGHGGMGPGNELYGWFKRAYEARYGRPPIFVAYHAASAILGLKAAYEAAAGAHGRHPDSEQIAAAFRDLRFESPRGRIAMSEAGGQQARLGVVVGRVVHRDGRAELQDLRRLGEE